ncbi:uncharacterized protein LOC127476806 [Manacus candei]|uniref:uncharacterized protein LOC127476806 n=1 Tax=Manacus candei TaxID=415023 RepID=UPI0022271A22|nr:uncharacterized protein LOC127476806 [Manacus candei]
MQSSTSTPCGANEKILSQSALCALLDEVRAEAASPSLSRTGNCRGNGSEIGACSTTVHYRFLFGHLDGLRSDSCCHTSDKCEEEGLDSVSKQVLRCNRTTQSLGVSTSFTVATVGQDMSRVLHGSKMLMLPDLRNVKTCVQSPETGSWRLTRNNWKFFPFLSMEIDAKCRVVASPASHQCCPSGTEPLGSPSAPLGQHQLLQLLPSAGPGQPGRESTATPTI